MMKEALQTSKWVFNRFYLTTGCRQMKEAMLTVKTPGLRKMAVKLTEDGNCVDRQT